MRKITNAAIAAFEKGQEFKSKNTKVKVNKKEIVLISHGNEIAFINKRTGSLSITNAGWRSNVTKERLNAITGVSIQQKNFVWFLNGKEWSGKLIKIDGVKFQSEFKHLSDMIKEHASRPLKP